MNDVISAFSVEIVTYQQEKIFYLYFTLPNN